MRRSFLFGAAVVALSAATLVPAQTTTKMPVYRVKDEVVVKGKVAEVQTVPDWMGRDGLNVKLLTAEAATIHVDAAPASFLKMLDFPIAAGDDLEITGVWGEWDSQPVFLVHQVRNKKVTLNVRDPNGSPLW